MPPAVVTPTKFLGVVTVELGTRLTVAILCEVEMFATLTTVGVALDSWRARVAPGRAFIGVVGVEVTVVEVFNDDVVVVVTVVVV